jgi:hypothetical protein
VNVPFGQMLIGQGLEGSSLGGRNLLVSIWQAPCVFPKACPPPMSATVSSAFIDMRPNVWLICKGKESKRTTTLGQITYRACGAVEIDVISQNSSRIDVNKPNCRCSKRIHAFSIDGAWIRSFLLFGRTHQNGLRAVILVRTSRTKTNLRETALFNGDFSRQDDQITPAQTETILFLDGIEQSFCLIQICVVGP